VNGEALPQAELDRIALEGVALERGVGCDACHGRRADGLFSGGDRNPLRLPKAVLCDRCHNAESVVFEDFRDRGVLVRHPQSEMVTGTAGEAAPGDPATATTSHSLFADRCVACHGVPAGSGASHSFVPSLAACASCHPGLSTFDRTAGGDYDGDGAVEGIQAEVAGLLDHLRNALLSDPQITFAGGRFDRGGATDHALAGASEAQKRAAFNWYSVEDDGSLGVHNAARAVRLLQGSYREITGTDVPGATLR
jgi:mono/diheme cytochrome c family protein